MKIGELSEKSGISQRMIRYYETQGILHPKRTETNYRNYSQSDLTRLMRIQNFQDAGLTLRVINSLMPCFEEAARHCDNGSLILDVLDLERQKIEKRIKLLQTSLDTLIKYIEDVAKQQHA